MKIVLCLLVCVVLLFLFCLFCFCFLFCFVCRFRAQGSAPVGFPSPEPTGNLRSLPRPTAPKKFCCEGCMCGMMSDDDDDDVYSFGDSVSRFVCSLFFFLART
jgi:hypothetical protein